MGGVISKVLKIVGAIAGIAAAAVTGGLSLGISAGLLTGVAAVATLGSSLLAKRPKAPDVSPEAINRLRANIDVNAPRKTVVGSTAMNTDIRDEEFTNDQTFFHRFIVVAAHKVQAINQIWFDDKLAWSLSGGVQGEFVGYLDVTPILEGSAANAINISARMGATRRYTGCAYVHIKYRLTGLTSKVQSPFASSITTRITIRGDGAIIYDPRQDSTVGGSGAHRYADQSTWTWGEHCRNTALHELFYERGWYINGELSVGLGLPIEDLDIPAYIAAANICDELVTKVGGGTEPRYRTDTVWSEGDDPGTVRDTLKTSMGADLDDVDGNLRPVIFTNDLAIVQAAFTEKDVLDGFEWVPSLPLNETYNIIRGKYTDASDVSLYQLDDYPELSIPSVDGKDRIEQFDLPAVQSVGQAQRLASARFERAKASGTFTAEFDITAWAVQKNSVVTLTFAPCGFAAKLFRVAEMELKDTGTVALVLREETAAIYVAPTLVTPASPVAASNYNFNLSPVNGAFVDISASLAAVSAGGAYHEFTAAVSSATLVPVGIELSATAPASGDIDLSASYQFTTAETTGTYGMLGQWFDVTGAPAAIDIPQAGDAFHDPENTIVGTGNVINSVTGLTAGNVYKYRLYMQTDSGTIVRNVSGSTQVTPV